MQDDHRQAIAVRRIGLALDRVIRARSAGERAGAAKWLAAWCSVAGEQEAHYTQWLQARVNAILVNDRRLRGDAGT